MDDDIDTANYADLKTLEDRVRRTLFAHGFNEKTSTPLGDMNSLCRNLVQDAAATDAELAALQAKLAESEAQRAVLLGALEECRMKLRRAADGLAESNSACAARALRDIKPVEVEHNADADTCNALWGERYGVDWVYSSPPDQPPSDLVALVKAAEAWRDAHEHYMAEWSRRTHDGKAEAVHAAVAASLKAENALKAALDTLLTNQPGFRALIESEGV